MIRIGKAGSLRFIRIKVLVSVELLLLILIGAVEQLLLLLILVVLLILNWSIEL